ncbi:MAG TPA: 4-hydroxyphenylacetate 3-hydroxylase N-terminal domain-containing protein [Candidatus Binataceae bacterium]|nr:4-hydroxyphenylacetate 3-hydroxylase N-terminal domain-containing protein [Candidatus Binataceae bacterium]
MGARTGKQYIDALRDGRSLHVNGERISDVTGYPPFQGVINELAALYDRQHQAATSEILTYSSPSSGQPVSVSFIVPASLEDLQRRVAGERARVEFTSGMMGRLPDQMNAWMADIALLKDFLGQREPRFGANAWNYYELCREQDFALTHTLIDPQIDRSKGLEAQEGLRIVKETGAGLMVSGARMLSTLAPISHEILVAPYMPRRPGEEDYAIVFSIPVATPGLKFICREPYDAGRSAYDRPFSSRYDEGDAIAIFKDVLVPWERVFAARDLGIYNLIQPMLPGMFGLQAVTRGVVKLRFMTGLANLVARAVGRDEMPRYQEMLGELVANVELAEGLLLASTHEVWTNIQQMMAGVRPRRQSAVPGYAAGVGTMFGAPGKTLIGLSTVRMFLPKAHSHAVDVLRLMGSSGLVMTPTEKDFNNPELREILPQYLRGAGVPAADRVRIMKLAWDAIGEQFGSRSLLYELFFAGDPISNRMLYMKTETNRNCVAMVERFVESLKDTLR